MFCIGLACCTYVVPMATLNTGGRYTAMMLMPCASGMSTTFHEAGLWLISSRSSAPNVQDHQPPHAPTYRQASSCYCHAKRYRRNIQYLGFIPLLRPTQVLCRFWMS
jgi:hypothetical protein